MRYRLSRQRTESARRRGRNATIGVLEQLPVNENVPVASAVPRESAAAMRETVRGLSPAHTAAIRDPYVERMPSKVIAERTGTLPAANDKVF